MEDKVNVCESWAPDYRQICTCLGAGYQQVCLIGEDEPCPGPERA